MGRNQFSVFAVALLVFLSLATDCNGFVAVPKSSSNKFSTALAFKNSKGDFSNFEINQLSSQESFDPLNFFQKKHESFDSKLSSTKFVDSLELVEEQQGNFAVTDSSDLNIWVARGLLLLVAAIWGTNFASVKYLSTLCFESVCDHTTSEAALARFGVAALVSLPLLYKQNWDVIKAGLECGIFISLGYLTQAIALADISSGKCAFICSLTVVVVPLLSALLYGKPVKPMNIAAAVIALSGVGLLEGLVDFQELFASAPALAASSSVVDVVDSSVVTAASLPVAEASSSMEIASAAAAAAGPLEQLAAALGIGKGDLIALGQPIGFGYSFIQIEHYVEKYKNVENRVLTIAAAECVAVGILSLLWVLYDFHGTVPDLTYMVEPHRMAAVLWTGIVTTVVAIYLEGMALQKASATDAALCFASEPVWASMFGLWLLSEQLSLNSYIGGAVILVACLVGALSDMPSMEPSLEEELETA